MITEREKENMVQFLVKYFGGDQHQLNKMNYWTLEKTYEFAYSRIEMENNF